MHGRSKVSPGKVSGAGVLKGTRMPVPAIFENLEAGANIDDIVEAVIEFAVRSLDNVLRPVMRVFFDQGTPVPIKTASDGI